MVSAHGLGSGGSDYDAKNKEARVQAAKAAIGKLRRGYLVTRARFPPLLMSQLVPLMPALNFTLVPSPRTIFFLLLLPRTHKRAKPAPMKSQALSMNVEWSPSLRLDLPLRWQTAGKAHGCHGRAVHQPHSHCAVRAMMPNDVSFAIAIHITHLLNFPLEGHAA